MQQFQVKTATQSSVTRDIMLPCKKQNSGFASSSCCSFPVDFFFTPPLGTLHKTIKRGFCHKKKKKTHSHERCGSTCKSRKAKVETTQLCSAFCLWETGLSLQQELTPHPTGVREEAELDCVAEGFITSVSHEPRGAAAAVTDCVISLRAFHTIKLPTVFRQETLFFFPFFSFCLRGAGAVFQKPRRMHKHKRAQVKVELFKWMITMEGRWKDSRQDYVWKQQHGGGKHSGVLSGQSSRLSRPRFRLSPLDLAAGDLGCK